jgi:hypothetical protein
MKQVHHLAIIGQPALVEGKTSACPHCGEPALVREDGSVFCVDGNKSFTPESTDGELHTMRLAFDERQGIKLGHRHQMVPMMLATSGFDQDPNGGFHPELSGVLERVAQGLMLTGSMNRVYA